uniref:phage portal protein n=1 Tax=Pontiella sp. TaxID=2837462 RepID=UPI00356ABFED
MSDIYAAPGTRALDNAAAPATLERASSPGNSGLRLSSRRSRGFDFAENGRFTGEFNSATLTADQAVFYAIQTTRNRARELEQTHPLTRKFITQTKDGVIGSAPLRFQSKAADFSGAEMKPDPGARSMIERRYRDFSHRKNYSLDHRLNRRRSSRMEVARLIVDGEVFIRKIRAADNPHRFTTQIIDADLCDIRLNTDCDIHGHRIIMGVKVDANHRPISYFFRPQPVGPFAGVLASPIVGEHIEIPADEIIHLYEPERPGQTRGLTYLAPAGMRAKLLDGLETSVLVGYKVAAAKMGFLMPGEGYEGDEIDPDDIAREVAPGQLDLLPKGVQFGSFDPAYPNAEYDVIKTAVSKEIASAFGVSYPELGNSYEGLSFSAGQLARDADEKLYDSLRATLVEEVEEEVYRGWLSMQLVFGLLPFPIKRKKKYEEVRFLPPRKKPVDGLKDAKTKELRASIYDVDPYEMAAESGADFEDRLDNIARAKAACEERGLPFPSAWGGDQAEDPVVEALITEPEPPAAP